MNRSLSCPIFTQCGLCSLLPKSKEEEREQKIQLLTKLFSQPVHFVDSPRELHYRKRISMRTDKNGVLGYYKPKSHTLIPVQYCAIADERINVALHNLNPCPTPIRSIEFRTNGDKVVVQVYSPKGRTISSKKIRSWLDGVVDAIALDHRTIHHDPYLAFTISDVQHQFHPQSFFQVNSDINELLVDDICSRVNALQPSHILDLFAGAGNIGLALARKGYNVTLMESAPTSCADAQQTSIRNNINAKMIQSSVENYTVGSIFFDLLILDPPRAGCGNKLKDFIITKPANIIYVSCHPYSLKRDASLLEKEGYTIQDITAYNMFPGTEHVETLCSFVRKS